MVSATETAAVLRASDARVIGLVSAAHFMSHVYILVLPPLFAYVQRDYGLSYFWVAMALSAFNIVSATLQAPAGFLVDRWGPDRLLIGGLTLGALALAGAALIPSYWALVTCFALGGFANTVFHPADYSILSHSIAAKRIGTAFSIHTFSGLAGTAAAPISMITAAALWGWRGAFLAAAAVGIAVSLVLLADRRVLAAAHTAPKHRSAGLSARESMRLLRSPVILRNLFFFLLLALASSGMWSFTIVALGALYGTPAAIASKVLTVYLVMAALGVLLGGFIADRTRRHATVAAIGLAIGAAAVLTVATVNLGTWMLILAMVVAGTMNGVIQPSRDMIVRAVTPAGSVGKVFGFVTAGFNVGGVLGPLVYAFMMDHGAPRGVFLTVGALTLISLATVMMPQSRVPVAVPAE